MGRGLSQVNKEFGTLCAFLLCYLWNAVGQEGSGL